MKRLFLLACLAAASLLFVQPISRAVSSPGDPDPTFGGFDGDGKWFLVDYLASRIDKTAVQKDGKVLLAGTVYPGSIYSGFRVFRLNLDGSQDHSFNNDGEWINGLSNDYNSLNDISIQSDGKILLAGESKANDEIGSFWQATVVRLLPDGSLDTSFSTDGIAHAFLVAHVFARAMVLQPDGKIVLAGYAVYYTGSKAYDPEAFVNQWVLFRFDASGALDPTFDGDGIVITNIPGGSYEMAEDVALQTDGKIVVAGYDGGDFVIARYNSDGSLDASFDGDGIVITGLGGIEHAYALAIQADGKILVAGGATAGGAGDKIAFARYLSNGALDGSFGNAGTFITSFNGTAYDLALQPDGMAVAAAKLAGSTYPSQAILVRVNTNGTLDGRFDQGGYTRAIIESSADSTPAVAIAPDGRLVLADSYSPDGSLVHQYLAARFMANGELDKPGRALIDFNPRNAKGYGVAVDAEGRITLAGDSPWSNSDWALARLTSAGLPDASFGFYPDRPGRVLLSMGGEQNARSLVLTPQGQALVAGYHQPYLKDRDFMVGRFTSSGDSDWDFNFVGFNITDYGHGDDSGEAMAVRPDGKIAVAGYAFNGANNDFAVARYLPDGHLDTGFSIDGMASVNFGSYWEAARAVVVQPDNKFVLAGGYGGDFALARFKLDGLSQPLESDVDWSFGDFGIVTDDFGGNDVASALLLQPDGKLVAAGVSVGPANDYFALNRYLANGDPDPGFGGKKYLNFLSGSNDRAYALARRGDGLIAVAGCSTFNGISHFALALLDGNGNLVSGFGTNGMVITAFGGIDDCARAMTFDPSGNILVAGYANMGGRYVFAVARYLAPPLAGRLFFPLISR